jgi:hypothetical protein
MSSIIEETIVNNNFPRGEYQDILIGPQGEVVWKRPWRQNLIVEGMGKLLAASVKGDKQGIALNYWAVGDGDANWEQQEPTDADRRTWSMLKHETGRNPIFPGQMTFLDDQEQPSSQITDRLKIVANFTVENIDNGGIGDVRILREFGLFADGQTDSNSGTLINHCIHTPFELKFGQTLQRTLHLIFWKRNSNHDG